MSKMIASMMLASLLALTGACGGDLGIDHQVVECSSTKEVVLVGPTRMAKLPDELLGEELVVGELHAAQARAEEPRLDDDFAQRVPGSLQRKPRCMHHDTVYWPGQVYPVGDGCNVCLCNDSGDSTCTLVDCQKR